MINKMDGMNYDRWNEWDELRFVNAAKMELW